MSGYSTLQQVALCTVELTDLRKVSFPPASSVMWPSPPRAPAVAPARSPVTMRPATSGCVQNVTAGGTPQRRRPAYAGVNHFSGR